MEQAEQTRKKVIQTLTILAVMTLFFLALGALRREIRMNRLEDVLLYFHDIPAGRFFEALLFSLGSYLALTFYDFLGLKNMRKPLGYPRTALTSFIAYTFSHNIGASPITGGGIRYRLYSTWGLTAGEAASVVVTCAMTFWVGFLTMGTVFFFLRPPDLPPFQLPPAHFLFMSFQFDSTVFSGLVFGAGIFCALVLAAYLLSAVFVRKTLKIARWQFPTPTVPIALGQMAAGSMDWICSGAALYTLLPSSPLSFPSFMTIYLSAQIIGFISQVPGGLGVLDVVILETLEPVLPATSIAGSLLAFRVCYYIIPFVMGLFSFTGFEVVRNREGFKRALRILDRFAPDVAPHLFALLVFAGGAVLFFSNATPEVNHHMVWLNERLPLGLMEGSHFFTSILAALLLVAARGVQQRLQPAYVLSLVLLGAGAVSCLLKGFDYQEALLLLAVFAALLPSGRYFSKRSSVFQQRYPPVWVTAVLFVLLGSIWIGVFNNRYEDYSSDLWTTFDLSEDAARFLRATVGSSATLLVFSLISLFSPSQPETEFPSVPELAKALGAVRKTSRATAGLALMGDKALFFNKKSDSFLMYAIEGKSWIALGDPAGDEKDSEDLAVKFKDLGHRKGAGVLFFLVDQKHFQFYLDMGLTVMKAGEEARVPLKSFKLESLPSADLKTSHQKLKERDGYAFEVLPEGSFGGLLPELRKVSEGWLSKNKSREMGFSVGFFDEKYLERFPLAVARKDGKVEAFANLLLSDAKEEAMADLLRSSLEAPAALEDYLLLESMMWAKAKGYQWFTLGTAPLLDVEESPLAPFKDKIAQILSPYAHVLKLPDIRKEKERFNPEWAPKYLAASASLPLATAFANILALISKGGRTGAKK